jgi:hypothetical protein
MVWGSIRIGLFITAFLIGMFISHPVTKPKQPPTPILNETAGATLLVACANGQVLVERLRERQDAVGFRCLRSGMLVVRDNSQPVPAKNPPFYQIHRMMPRFGSLDIDF